MIQIVELRVKKKKNVYLIRLQEDKYFIYFIMLLKWINY